MSTNYYQELLRKPLLLGGTSGCWTSVGPPTPMEVFSCAVKAKPSNSPEVPEVRDNRSMPGQDMAGTAINTKKSKIQCVYIYMCVCVCVCVTMSMLYADY